jgi:hypothetical protein
MVRGRFCDKQDVMKPSIIFLLLATAAGPALAQPTGGKPNRVVPTVTRTLHIFGELENQWLDAVQSGDQAAIDKIVAPNFELRSALQAGTPTPRAESLKQSLALPKFESSIGKMAAHEYGDTVILSFEWKLKPVKNSALPERMFVVDTWRQTEAGWQVVTRYIAPIGESAKSPPGAVVEQNPIQKRM